MKVKTNIEGLRSLSQIFSPSNFKRIVRRRDYHATAYRIKKYTYIKEDITNFDALNLIYKSLLKSYRNEYVYKNTLLNKLLIKEYGFKNTVALNEFRIGSSIADFVLLNGEARIYEIKTELDNLTKLDKQISEYCKFGNKVYIVTSAKHLEKLLETYANTTIGIIELTQGNTLKTVKSASSNEACFDCDVLFKTLRKQEYISLIKSHFNSIPDLPNTKIFKECLKICKTIEVAEFQRLVLKKLKQRNIDKPELLKDESIPESLKHICYTLNFNKDEYDELNSFLKKSTIDVFSIPTRQTI